MALSRDDRLLESMQEFRIYGGADHILGIGMTTSSESTKQNTETRKTLYKGIYNIYIMYKNIEQPKTTVHGKVDTLRKVSLQELSMNWQFKNVSN